MGSILPGSHQVRAGIVDVKLDGIAGLLGWKPRWLVLDRSALTIYKNKAPYISNLNQISLDSIHGLDLNQDKQYSMSIVTTDGRYHLAFRTYEELDNWRSSIWRLSPLRKTNYSKNPLPHAHSTIWSSDSFVSSRRRMYRYLDGRQANGVGRSSSEVPSVSLDIECLPLTTSRGNIAPPPYTHYDTKSDDVAPKLSHQDNPDAPLRNNSTPPENQPDYSYSRPWRPRDQVDEAQSKLLNQISRTINEKSPQVIPSLESSSVLPDRSLEQSLEHDSPESQRLIQLAISMLCKEVAKAPVQTDQTSFEADQWNGTIVRMRPLLKLWNETDEMEQTTEEYESKRQTFCEALQNGVVLCYLANKLLASSWRLDQLTSTPVYTFEAFIETCLLLGLPSLSPDDLEGRRIHETSLVRVAQTVVSLIDCLHPSADSKVTRPQSLSIAEAKSVPVNYKLLNCIGHGQSGFVHRALNVQTCETVAIKRIPLSDVNAENVRKYMNIIRASENVFHPNISRYKGFLQDDYVLSIASEYEKFGSLARKIAHHVELSESVAKSHTRDILNGLSCLHWHGIIHYNLKAANVLIAEDGTLKISDFGAVYTLRTVELEFRVVAGIPNWMAPEVILLKGASDKSDIWSLGCTIIEMLTGHPPYTGIPAGIPLLFRIIESDPPEIPFQCSAHLREFLLECFIRNPLKRPSADCLSRHDWLSPNSQMDMWSNDDDSESSEYIPSQSVDIIPKDIADSVNPPVELPIPSIESLARTSLQSSVEYRYSGCKVYQHLFTFLTDVARSRSKRIEATLREYHNLVKSLDSVSSLVESQECRLNLLQISHELGLSDDPRTRGALQKDEADIASLLRSVINSDTDKKEALLLREDAAQRFLNVIQGILDSGLLLSDGNLKARRFLVKLSEICDMLPSSLLIKGVRDCDVQATFGGGFGDIYQATYQDQVVALKRMRIFARDSGLQKIRRRFCREALVWQNLKNAYVLPFLGIDTETFPGFLCMVSPWMRHGTVVQYLADNGDANVDRLLYEIAEGLAYLHSQNIVHGDLRGSNILVDDSWHARLTDFGLTGFAETTAATQSTNRAGSVRWMAPELHHPESFGLQRFQRTYASDVYAFACVCLELYTGCPPFMEFTHDVGAMLQVIAGSRPKRPEAHQTFHRPMSDSLWALVEVCWSQQFTDRPSASYIVDRMEYLG